VDFFLEYSNGDAGMSLRTKIAVLNAEVPVKISITLKSLRGRVKLVCLPLPMAKMGFSFSEHPEMVLDIDIHVGGEKGISFSPDKLKSLLKKKFNEMIAEKFVVPNRKYIRIPGIPKQDPLGKEVSYRVKSEVNFPISADNPEIIEFPLDATIQADLPKIPVMEDILLNRRAHSVKDEKKAKDKEKKRQRKCKR